MHRAIYSLPIYVVLCGIFYGVPATAETVFLKDGSSFECSVLHYYDNTLHLILPTGDHLVINRPELEKIVFSAPSKEPKAATTDKLPAAAAKKPRSEFSTPKKTIETWRQAMKKGDLDGMANCFVTTAQPLMLQKLNDLPETARKKIVHDAKKGDFTIGKPVFQEDRAQISITNKIDKSEQTEQLSLLLENGEWKLLPNE